MASRQSNTTDARPLSPSIPTLPSAADPDISLSASSKAILSSLECINDYVRKHYDRYAEQQSLKHGRLIASFAEKEQTYERQISALRTTQADIAGLLTRERSANDEVRRKLDIVTNSLVKLCKVIGNASFTSVDHKRSPHRIKQEGDSQEDANVSDMATCPKVAISPLVSQLETVFSEMRALNDPGTPPPADPPPGHSAPEAIASLADSLLRAHCSFAMLLENRKTVDKARLDSDSQNQSLREQIVLLEEQLKQSRGDHEKISQELAAALLEKERHVCRPPASAYPTPAPAARDDYPASLPSPPLEKRDLTIPEDILLNARKIGRDENQAPPKRVTHENTITPPQTPIVKAGPSFASTSTSGELRKTPTSGTAKREQSNPTSSSTQGGSSKGLTVRIDQQTAGPSMPPPSAPVQSAKRTSGGIHKRQNTPQEPPPPPSISQSVTLSSDRTADPRPRKKRRINGASSAPSSKTESTGKKPGVNVNSVHIPAPTTGPLSASASRHSVAQWPTTKASDLKSLKFSKNSQPSEPPSTPVLATSSNVNAPTNANRPPMTPLELSKKSPRERAALRKSK